MIKPTLPIFINLMNDHELVNGQTTTDLLAIAIQQSKEMLKRIGFNLADDEILISGFRADNITQFASDATIRAINSHNIPLYITLMREGEMTNLGNVAVSYLTRILKVSNFFNLVINDKLELNHLPPSLGRVYVDLRKIKKELPNENMAFIVINDYQSSDVLDFKLRNAQLALFTMGYVLINEVIFIIDKGDQVMGQDYQTALKFGQVELLEM